jgi:hypothetical protein
MKVKHEKPQTAPAMVYIGDLQLHKMGRESGMSSTYAGARLQVSKALIIEQPMLARMWEASAKFTLLDSSKAVPSEFIERINMRRVEKVA